MEPILGVDLSLFPPYGSSSLGRDSRLSGSFGNASLDGVTDYYSQLIYKVLVLLRCPTRPSCDTCCPTFRTLEYGSF